ncbi:MAG: FAD:protein FMN transferase [Eubacterium sp.]
MPLFFVASVSVFCYNSIAMKKFVCIILSLLLAVACCSCSSDGGKKQRYQTSFIDLFDTASTVIAYDTSQEAFDSHYQQFYDKLAEYDKLYDIYTSYEGMNNLCTLNMKAKDGPVTVDSRIIDLLEYCKQVYEISSGKTNVCFGSVLGLWHDSREYAENNPQEAALPDMNKLKEAAKHTDINDLVIDRENSTVYYADPDLRLDVGAVAKGYAVNQVCRWAQENLWTSAAVSIGGNVCTFGYKNDDGKTLWNIGIENPDLSSDDYLVNVKITDLSVVTSGDYQRYFTVDGKKYCHIINPETLMPAEYVASVSVLCTDSALGDALSTTLFNMPVEEGVKLIESMENVEAVWVDKNYNRTYSSGFEKYITE